MVPYESKATRTIWASLIQWLSSLAVSWQVSIEQVPSSASRPADLVAAAPGKPPASHFWWSLADCLSQEFFSHAGLSSSSMLFCQILFLCSCLCWHLQSCIRRNFSGHGAFWSLLYIILDSGNSSFFCVWGVLDKLRTGYGFVEARGDDFLYADCLSENTDTTDDQSGSRLLWLLKSCRELVARDRRWVAVHLSTQYPTCCPTELSSSIASPALSCDPLAWAGLLIKTLWPPRFSEEKQQEACWRTSGGHSQRLLVVLI